MKTFPFCHQTCEVARTGTHIALDRILCRVLYLFSVMTFLAQYDPYMSFYLGQKSLEFFSASIQYSAFIAVSDG